MYFLQNNELREVAVATGTGTSTIKSAEVNTALYDTVTFFVNIAVEDVLNYIKVEQDEVTGMAGAADLEGSKVTALANGDLTAIEVYKPLEGFVKLVVTRGVSTALGPIYAILSKGRRTPEDNNLAGEIVSKTIISPEYGTA